MVLQFSGGFTFPDSLKDLSLKGTSVTSTKTVMGTSTRMRRGIGNWQAWHGHLFEVSFAVRAALRERPKLLGPNDLHDVCTGQRTHEAKLRTQESGTDLQQD